MTRLHYTSILPPLLVALGVSLSACDMGGDASEIEEGAATTRTLQDESGENYGTTREAAASALVAATDGSGVKGEVRFLQDAGQVEISGQLTGLTEGRHGFHVHQNGDCSNSGKAAGEHFAPGGDPHGAPTDSNDEHHVGDLGNIVADADGRAVIDVSDSEMTLDSGPNGILGRSVVVHAQADDLESQPSGASGDRIACGVISPERIDRAAGS